MSIYRLGNRIPQIHPTAFVADNATIIGDVVIGTHASIWFNVVIRGDNDRIMIGKNSNIQDASILHANPGYPLTVGKNVTVGHMAMLHGCTVGNGTLIAENKHFRPGVILLGTPARITRTMDDEKAARMPRAASHYV